jgi:HAD superfamily hydrolase (TIGR01509 family)
VESPAPVIRAVVFDLDGVLLDSESINVRAAFEAFASFGHPLDEADVARIVGRHPMDYAVELMRQHGVPESAGAELRRIQEEAYQRLWNEGARLLDGAEVALHAVRARGLKTGLATSSGRGSVQEALDRFGLQDAFDATLTLDDVAARKPDPEIYLRASERLGVVPDAMLVVEDSCHGITAAKAARAWCVAVRTPWVAEEAQRLADWRIGSLRDLLTVPPLA